MENGIASSRRQRVDGTRHTLLWRETSVALRFFEGKNG
jgi:hypothetical protein